MFSDQNYSFSDEIFFLIRNIQFSWDFLIRISTNSEDRNYILFTANHITNWATIKPTILLFYFLSFVWAITSTTKYLFTRFFSFITSRTKLITILPFLLIFQVNNFGLLEFQMSWQVILPPHTHQDTNDSITRNMI